MTASSQTICLPSILVYIWDNLVRFTIDALQRAYFFLPFLSLDPAIRPSLDARPNVLTQSGQYHVSGRGPLMLTQPTWN